MIEYPVVQLLGRGRLGGGLVGVEGVVRVLVDVVEQVLELGVRRRGDPAGRGDVLSESASYHGVVSFELGIYGESNK
jgi:hypothetical protein